MNYSIIFWSAGRRQKKKSRRRADTFSRAYETAALIFRAAVSLRLHKPMTTCRDTVADWRLIYRVPFAFSKFAWSTSVKKSIALDCENGIENAVLLKPQTPEMVLEEKQFQEQVYAAVMKLPEKQAKRIYARYYLGMTVNEIAEVEGVDPSRVRDSIRRGLKQLVKYFW